MKRKTLTFVGLCLALLFSLQHVKAQESVVGKVVPYAYVSADLSGPTITFDKPTGSSTLESLSLVSAAGAEYSAEYNGWALKPGTEGIMFNLNVERPGRVQMVLKLADFHFSDGNQLPANPYIVGVSNTTGGTTFVTEGTVVKTDLEGALHIIEIPQYALQPGANSVEIALQLGGPDRIFLQELMFLPQKIKSSDGALNTTIYTQFGETEINGIPNVNSGKIWTRAYGLHPNVEMLPGPTFYFKPGELLNVNLTNKLNINDPMLKRYETLMGENFNPDETLVGDHLRGEINIPHNLNNTNLHVHGLHVDPSKDDVTIVIVPEGADSTGYDAPHSHGPTKHLDSLNAFSVSDQSVKGGKWDYQYKIPPHHLPGTHWYHPHKHGSTSAQVENGLAGTIVIEESEDNAMVPWPKKKNGKKKQNAYDLEEWLTYHDRVFAMQEITNFGAQFGKGSNSGAKMNGIATPADPNPGQVLDIQVTVNGKLADTITVRPGQLERWRMVNAGTNHRAFSQMWLGKHVGTHNYQDANGNSKTAQVYQSTPIYLAAVDGITLPELKEVTAERPALLAPGNRSDFLVQLPDTGKYTLFKDYQLTDPYIAVLSTDGKDTLYNSVTNPSSFWPEAAPTKENPYLFAKTGVNSSNFQGFTQPWNASQNGTGTTSIVPLIKTQTIKDGTFLDVQFATASEFRVGEVGKWQPYNFGAGLTDADLFTVHVTGDAVDPKTTPQMPTTAHLNKVAAVTMTDPPSYASPISDNDVLQSRPVMFDVSGLRVNVDSKRGGYNGNVNQFTLNGRFFELNDMIGNPGANAIIQTAYSRPTQLESARDLASDAIPQNLTFNDFNTSASTNKVGSSYYFTNPGYYQSISSSVVDGITSYGFSGTGKPSWELLTGIEDVTVTKNGQQVTKPRPSIVNTSSKFYTEKNKTLLDSLPLAQTAEEWLLINNSDVSHPFHIHINPFFVVEVGQLSYETYVDSNGNSGTDWFMRSVTADGYGPARQPFPAKGAVPGSVYKGTIGVDAIVGNWWDTITIPAHGYVKVRYWFNVPYQTGEGAAAEVHDNHNRTGIWVYHCHILRHEDRGMMMPVITIKNNNPELKED